MGALSDLLILQYAEQSSRLRASSPSPFSLREKGEGAGGEGSGGGILAEADRLARNWLNLKAAEAFQAATGEPVSLPTPEVVDIDGLAEAIYEVRRPIELNR
jgi:hypothetical protein